MTFSRGSPEGRSRSMSGHSPRSSERKRSNSSSIFTGSMAVMPKRVADRAVRRRAAPLAEDPLAAAELDDVPDDEEVAGEAELLDHRQLLAELRLGARRERTETGPRMVPGDLPEIGGRRLARGEREVGEAVAEIGEGEVELLRRARRRGSPPPADRRSDGPSRRRAGDGARGAPRGASPRASSVR